MMSISSQILVSLKASFYFLIFLGFIIFLSTYTCIARDLYVTASNARLMSIEGKHERYFSNEDVNDVAIISQSTIHIPDGLGRTFPNLKLLEIMSSQAMFVHRRNFVGMNFLVDLRLDDNLLEIIPSDTFWDLKSLQWLSLTGNQIKTLPIDLLIKSFGLLWLTADENEVEKLDEKFLQSNSKVEMISMRNNKLIKIEFEFDNFKQMSVIDFRDNVCINAISDRDQEGFKFEGIQEAIRVNCS